MSGNQQDPDMICEVFVLAPTDLIDPTRSPTAERPARRRTTTWRVGAVWMKRGLGSLSSEGIRAEAPRSNGA